MVFSAGVRRTRAGKTEAIIFGGGGGVAAQGKGLDQAVISEVDLAASLQKAGSHHMATLVAAG